MGQEDLRKVYSASIGRSGGTEEANSRLVGELISACDRLTELTAAFEHGQTDLASLRTNLYLRHLFDADIIGILFADSEGQIARANDLFLETVGYATDELPLCWHALTPPEWRDLDRAKTRELRESGRVAPWEKELYHRDGRRIPIIVGAGPAADTERAMVAFVLDLSSLKQTEADLRATKERFRLLYDNIPLMYFSLDLAGVIRSVNALGARELGFQVEELIGQPAFRLFHPEDRPQVERNVRHYLETPDGVAKWEARKIRKDGSVFWVSETVALAVGPDGQPEILVICEDVTERKRTEEKLLAHEESLQLLATAVTAAEERERRRIGNGLHDQIGQMLATAMLKLDQLLQPRGAGVDVTTITEVRQLVDRSIAMTRSLTFELTSPVLYELGLEAALNDLGERAQRQGGFRFRFDGNASPTAISEELATLLFRVARELVHNVVKHAEAHELSIALESTPQTVRIRIWDDGVGFDVSGAGEDFASTGGCGLFSVREQVGRLGGRLVLDSTPGRGTRIEVVVPVEPRSSTRAASGGGS